MDSSLSLSGVKFLFRHYLFIFYIQKVATIIPLYVGFRRLLHAVSVTQSKPWEETRLVSFLHSLYFLLNGFQLGNNNNPNWMTSIQEALQSSPFSHPPRHRLLWDVYRKSDDGVNLVKFAMGKC